MSDTLKLLPCPFCGTVDLVEVHVLGPETGPGYQVACSECGSKGPFSECERDVAVASWNEIYATDREMLLMRTARTLLLAVEFFPVLTDFGTPGKPNLCYAPRIPVALVEKIRAILDVYPHG